MPSAASAATEEAQNPNNANAGQEDRTGAQEPEASTTTVVNAAGTAADQSPNITDTTTANPSAASAAKRRA